MYQLVDGQFTQMVKLQLGDGAAMFIPADPANIDYQRYLKWLDGYEEVNGEWVKTSDGNTPLPADQ